MVQPDRCFGQISVRGERVGDHPLRPHAARRSSVSDLVEDRRRGRVAPAVEGVPQQVVLPHRVGVIDGQEMPGDR